MWRLIFIFGITLYQAPTSALGQTLSKTEQEVMQAERERESATQRGDVKTVEKLTAEEFFLVDATGKAVGRAERIGRPPRKRLRDSYDDVKVRIYGDTAVLTSRRSWIWEDTNEAKSARIIKVWVKRRDQWRIVAAQNTDVTP